MTARDIFLQAAVPSETALPPGCRTCDCRGIVARGGSTEYWGCRSARPCPVLMAQGEIPQCFRMQDPAGVPDRPEEHEPFCACGRRASECDGSREACPTYRPPSWLREGAPVWYSPVIGAAVRYAGFVDGDPKRLGSGTWVAHLRDLEPKSDGAEWFFPHGHTIASFMALSPRAIPVQEGPDDLPVGDLPAGTPDAAALAVRLIEVAAYARMIEDGVEGEDVGPTTAP